MEYHHRDRYNLGSFNADLESEKLFAEYEKYQKAWDHSNAVGALPQSVCLLLAVKYQKLPEKAKQAEPEVAEKRAPAKKVTAKKVTAKA